MARSKLRGRGGMSLLFAILVFLVCALAGAAAVTAAASNAGRYEHLRSDQQKYLTLSSAARLVRDTAGGEGVTLSGKATLTKVETVTYTPPGVDANGNPIPAVGPITVIEYTFNWAGAAGGNFYTGPLESWLAGDMEKMLAGDIPGSMNVYGMTGNFPTDTLDSFRLDNLTAKGSDDLAASLGDPVTWSLAVADSYDLTAVFQLPGAEYKTELVIPAAVETVPGLTVTTTSSTSGTTVTTVTTTVTTWQRTVTWPLDGARFTQIKWDEAVAATTSPGP